MQAEAIQAAAPVSGVKADSLSALVDRRRHLAASMEQTKLWLNEIDAEILKRIDVNGIYDRLDKSYGEVTEYIDGHKFKVKIAKTVKWDSDALLSAAKKLPWELVSKVFDIEFSMGEKKYHALETQALGNDEAASLLTEVQSARTVKFADAKLVSVGGADGS